jgi:hypothetical protein
LEGRHSRKRGPECENINTVRRRRQRPAPAHEVAVRLHRLAGGGGELRGVRSSRTAATPLYQSHSSALADALAPITLSSRSPPWTILVRVGVAPHRWARRRRSSRTGRARSGAGPRGTCRAGAARRDDQEVVGHGAAGGGEHDGVVDAGRGGDDHLGVGEALVVRDHGALHGERVHLGAEVRPRDLEVLLPARASIVRPARSIKKKEERKKNDCLQLI